MPGVLKLELIFTPKPQNPRHLKLELIFSKMSSNQSNVAEESTAASVSVPLD